MNLGVLVGIVPMIMYLGEHIFSLGIWFFREHVLSMPTFVPTSEILVVNRFPSFVSVSVALPCLAFIPPPSGLGLKIYSRVSSFRHAINQV